MSRTPFRLSRGVKRVRSWMRLPPAGASSKSCSSANSNASSGSRLSEAMSGSDSMANEFFMMRLPEFGVGGQWVKARDSGDSRHSGIDLRGGVPGGEEEADARKAVFAAVEHRSDAALGQSPMQH